MFKLSINSRIKWDEKTSYRYFKDFVYLYNIRLRQEIILSKDSEGFLCNIKYDYYTISEILESMSIKSENCDSLMKGMQELCRILYQYNFIQIDGIQNQGIQIVNGLEDKGKRDSKNYLNNYFLSNPTIWNANIELLTDCNLRCIHCFNSNEMTYLDKKLAFKFITELKKMNTHKVILSGGEPLIHPDFVDIATFCSENNFVVDIFTNGYSLTGDLIKIFSKLNIREVQISLYSLDPKIHDKITQVNGSCVKALSSIRQLINSNISVSVSCPIIKPNKTSVNEIVEWGARNKIQVKFDLDMMPKSDLSESNLCYKLNKEEFFKVESILKESNSNKQTGNISNNSAEKTCLAGFNGITLGANGDLYPCPPWKGYVLGNAFRDDLYDVWTTSEKLSFIRKQNKQSFYPCNSCDKINVCRICFAKNFNQNKDILNSNYFYCENF